MYLSGMLRSSRRIHLLISERTEVKLCEVKGCSVMTILKITVTSIRNILLVFCYDSLQRYECAYLCPTWNPSSPPAQRSAALSVDKQKYRIHMYIVVHGLLNFDPGPAFPSHGWFVEVSVISNNLWLNNL